MVYGRIDDHTVLLASEFFLIWYGIRSSHNHQHAIAIQPYTIYGTVYSPYNSMGAFLVLVVAYIYVYTFISNIKIAFCILLDLLKYNA